MAGNDWLFGAPPGPLLPVTTTRRDGKPLSKLGQAEKRSQAARVTKMHGQHGPGPAGQTCGGCQHLVKIGYHRTYFKCRRYGVTSSQASDWRAKWPACGAFLKTEK